MSQRDSGYARKENDCYETPDWVTEALLPHLPRKVIISEPAAGSGKIANALARAGYTIRIADVVDGADYLQKHEKESAVVTNPPYGLADDFIRHALELTYPAGFVCMLLRTDFDHAKTRRCFFAEHRAFAKKLVLTKRIRWFEGTTGSPSFNHAWFIWDHQHRGAPTLAYGP